MSGGGWIALAGFLFHYYNSKIQKERDANLQRVNDQLKEFYGPLLACVTATKSAYEAMISQHSPDGTKTAFQQAVQQQKDGIEAQAFRLWTKQVLQPLNEKAATIITDHIDLLEASSIEPELLQLVAHVYAYRVTIERWDNGDTSARSVLSYPDKLEQYVREHFAHVKKKQAALLGGPERISHSKL